MNKDSISNIVMGIAGFAFWGAVIWVLITKTSSDWWANLFKNPVFHIAIGVVVWGIFIWVLIAKTSRSRWSEFFRRLWSAVIVFVALGGIAALLRYLGFETLSTIVVLAACFGSGGLLISGASILTTGKNDGIGYHSEYRCPDCGTLASNPPDVGKITHCKKCGALLRRSSW